MMSYDDENNIFLAIFAFGKLILSDNLVFLARKVSTLVLTFNVYFEYFFFFFF